MSTTMEDRVILLLNDLAGSTTEETSGKGSKRIGGHGFWERLAQLTGIASKRWRQVHARKQRVTSDMVEVLARTYPQHAFWLVTGITDALNGHVAPRSSLTFPERLEIASDATNDYFHCSLALVKQLYAEGNVDTEDEKQRMFATERTQPLGHWIASPLLDTAYELSASNEYRKLQKLWELREEDRSERLQKMATKPSQKQSTDGPRRIPILGTDHRTAHQSMFELFFRPKK